MGKPHNQKVHMARRRVYMSADGNRYSTHILELVRNNGISTMGKIVDQGFLMFDYFDILVHKELKGSEKQYVNYFSIGDSFDDVQAYKVSYKTLSLYCHSDDDCNPFVLKKDKEGRQDAGFLSETPFLGIIQISLCKENYVRGNSQPIDIECFLSKCEKEIMEMVREVHSVEENDSTVMQMYRSSTTGDFCLVIRSDSVEKIYKTALYLSDSQNDMNKTLKVRTYTNVGIECKICVGTDTGRKYAALDDTFIQKHMNMTFALRFSAGCGLLPLWEKYREQNGREQSVAAKGLFGRYDYLIHINLKEFSEIYPILCEKKFGMLEQPSGTHEDGVITLKNILQHPHVKNINERVLVSLETSGMERAGERDTDKEYLEKVQERNGQLFKRIEALSSWRCCFAEEDRAFRDLHRGMTEIYKTYSAIGMEKDAYINWLIFCRDMEVLCDCLEVSLKEYESIIGEGSQDETENRTHRLRLLKDWRISIQALNQYTRLVQNINYQTYQSPIYEIQTQIDTEKTMIAYRQAMMSYLDSYIEAPDVETEGVISSIPIIYPDLAKDRVEVAAPFSSQKKKGRQREIICTVPSFEYFGRMYDLLPWMLHESSHQLRILSRKERNHFFTEYVFSYVYKVILENELPGLADDSLYKVIGRGELRLVNCMVSVTMDDFIAQRFEDFGLERLISEIDDYLYVMFCESAGFEGRKAQYNIKDTREKVFDFFLSEYRREGMLKDEILEKIIKFHYGKTAGDGDDLVEPLLDCYFRQVNETAAHPLEDWEGIQVENVKRFREWFEKDVMETSEKLKKAEAMPEAVKEYFFKVAEIYRIMGACMAVHRADETKKKDIQEYLSKVFCRYQEQRLLQQWDEKDALLMDPRAMHVLRNLGLLNNDEKLFCSKMQDIFSTNDYVEIQKHKELKTKIYRESFADLLMATSLGIGSFGYCRQLLQTLSDSGMDEKGYGEDNINIHRFQVVTAVLLEEELLGAGQGDSGIRKDEQINQLSLDGSSIIENGIVYCEYTLKCIGHKMMENWKDAEREERKENLEYFLGDFNGQLKCFLKDVRGGENYTSTFLYILLHGREKADRDIVRKWEEQGYDNLLKSCQNLKYSFWRLEYFCMGLKNIMRDGCVIVPLDIFEHMKQIRQMVKKEDGVGCKWEKDWDCLAEPKVDVGRFYNDPKQVLEKTSSQKLENTIDFIQNYYYYNRFKMMEEET